MKQSANLARIHGVGTCYSIEQVTYLPPEEHPDELQVWLDSGPPSNSKCLGYFPLSVEGWEAALDFCKSQSAWEWRIEEAAP